MGMLVFVGLRGDSGRRRSSFTPLRYVGDMSGLDISIARWSSVFFREPPRKSFFVENLRARLEPVLGGGAAGVGGRSGVYTLFQQMDIRYLVPCEFEHGTKVLFESGYLVRHALYFAFQDEYFRVLLVQSQKQSTSLADMLEHGCWRILIVLVALWGR